MGIDILWYEVDWNVLTENYRGPEDLSFIDRAEAEEQPWLKSLEMHEYLEGYLNEWDMLFNFTDGLDPEIHGKFIREFPVLVQLGVIWDPETLSPAMMMDIPQDESEQITGALSPEHLREACKALAAIDKPRLAALLEEGASLGEDEFFESPVQYFEFLELFGLSLSKAAERGKGLLVMTF
ncbi:MAG: hypothetical protein V4726_13330 [Verrucomicrobiota bacterium]